MLLSALRADALMLSLHAFVTGKLFVFVALIGFSGMYRGAGFAPPAIVELGIGQAPVAGVVGVGAFSHRHPLWLWLPGYRVRLPLDCVPR